MTTNPNPAKQQPSRAAVTVYIILALAGIGGCANALGITSSPASSDPCEQRWEENKATAGRPGYADGGKARYIRICHDGDDLVRQLADEGIIK